MPTIKDVARACGLSPATVSYVLNNSRAVRPETRERVLAAVRRMDYSPSAVARGLSRKRMDTLGVVFPRAAESPVTDPYYAPVLDGILDVATRRRQNTTLFTGEVWEDAAHSIPVYRDGRCDGLLLIAPTLDSPVVDALVETSVPFVVIGSRTDDERLTRVDVDNAAAAAEVVSHLIGLGHRRIALLSREPLRGTFVAQRVEGWRRALAAAGLPEMTPEFTAGEGEPHFRPAVDRLLALPPAARPTALFVTRDEDALAVLECLQASGVRVPQEMSLAGFDDLAIAAGADPPLTTVRQPLREVGRAAADLLLARILDGAPAGAARILPTELVVRASTAAPHGP